KHVFAIKIGIVREQLIDRSAGADLADDHTDRDAHSTDARLAAHDGRVLRDAGKLVHRVILRTLPVIAREPARAHSHGGRRSRPINWSTSRRGRTSAHSPSRTRTS